MSQTFFTKPPGGLYSLPYLSEGHQMETTALSRAEWWEILFFIKKLEPKQQQEVNALLLQNLDDQVRRRRISREAPGGGWSDEVSPCVLAVQEEPLDDSSLISLAVPGDTAKKVLHYLKQKLPSSCLSDLLCSHAFSKHYLKRGGGSLDDEELLGEDSLGLSVSL